MRYFITQNRPDVPEDVLGQLGNCVHTHCRRYRKRSKALKQAAATYRHPKFDTAQAIREVGTSEAVTSMLIDKGVPGVERTLIRPPSSQLGPLQSLNARRLWPRRQWRANTTHDWIAIPRAEMLAKLASYGASGRKSGR
jgi:hypothetical protein